jgi:hypothetical protein
MQNAIDRRDSQTSSSAAKHASFQIQGFRLAAKRFPVIDSEKLKAITREFKLVDVNVYLYNHV